MLRPVARLMLLLIAVAALLLTLIRAQRYDDGGVKRFFNACAPMPCWGDIHPGETTLNQALAILRAHPWVETVSEVYASPYEGDTRTVLIYWTWSSGYPFGGVSRPTQQGIIITDQGIVRQVYLTTSLALGDLWLAFGNPQGGLVDYIYDTRHVRVDDTALFIRQGIAATATLIADCTDQYPNFWRTPVYLWLQTNVALANGSAAYPSYLRLLHLGYQQVRASFC
ncbi:MAG TPA: hypothetical protein VHD90_20850 [Phototrophicaceae bacterium]|nr:hypothetical protein [Phototrophicaceae bacterium]